MKNYLVLLTTGKSLVISASHHQRESGWLTFLSQAGETMQIVAEFSEASIAGYHQL